MLYHMSIENGSNNLPSKNYQFERKNKNFVSMNNGVNIEISPQSNDQTMYTRGVNGCTVVALYSEYPDGVRRGTLTHFEPAFIENSRKFFVNQKDVPIKTEAKIFTYGEDKKKYAPWELNIKRRTEKEINLITADLKKNFGEDTHIDLLQYSISENLNEEREINFTLKSKKEGEDFPAEIHWWNGNIKF